MKPLRIRIDRIVDFSTVVILVGVDLETSEPIAIHIDHRPFTAIREAWRAAGSPPIEYAADRLLLHLDLLPAEHADEARLTECAPCAAANHDRQPVQENEP